MKFGFGAGPAAALLFTAPGFAQDKASPAPGGQQVIVRDVAPGCDAVSLAYPRSAPLA